MYYQSNGAIRPITLCETPPYCGVIICVIPEIPGTMMSGVFALVRSPEENWP